MAIGKYAVEFIGTFFLVLVIGLTVMNPGGAGAMAPLAIAGVLMVMIYAGGHVSGAHYNPAVTLAVLIRGKVTPADAVPYVVAQGLAAGAGASLALYLKPDAAVTAMTPAVLPALVGEAVFTFALVWVILNVATTKSTSGNSYYGLAIAGTVLAGAYAVGGISGGAFNPAVALALGIWGLVKWADLWIHLAGSLGGAVAAAFVFKSLIPPDGRD